MQEKRGKLPWFSCLGPFLHAENDQDVIMFMRKTLAKLMAMIAPQTYLKICDN